MKGWDYMNLKDLRIEYRDNPIGLDVKKPRFSWVIKSDNQNVLQTAYQIVVTKEGAEVWNTGKVASSSSILNEYNGVELEACSLYKVNVEVWDNKGNSASIEGSFETGLLKGTNFSADWITHDFPQEETACPVFVKEFEANNSFSYFCV